ncbi:hypothetical protein J3F83DRAFT_33472 [Trichoderma novae-zelandiae]
MSHNCCPDLEPNRIESGIVAHKLGSHCFLSVTGNFVQFLSASVLHKVCKPLCRWRTKSSHIGFMMRTNNMPTLPYSTTHQRRWRHPWLPDGPLGDYLPLLVMGWPAASDSPCSKHFILTHRFLATSASSCMMNKPAPCTSQPSAAPNLPTREGDAVLEPSVERQSRGNDARSHLRSVKTQMKRSASEVQKAGRLSAALFDTGPPSLTASGTKYCQYY